MIPAGVILRLDPDMQATAMMTGTAFDALPYENEIRQELFDGECIEMPSTTVEHQIIVLNLGESLRPFLRSTRQGGVCPDVEFALGENTRLRPDLAVILGEDSLLPGWVLPVAQVLEE